MPPHHDTYHEVGLDSLSFFKNLSSVARYKAGQKIDCMGSCEFQPRLGPLCY